MRVGRRAINDRREPNFDATPIPGLDLRLDPRDRPGGPLGDDESRPRRGEGPREPRFFPPEAKGEGGRTAANDDHAGRAQGGRRAARRRNAKRGGGGGRRRAVLRRLIYWAAVLILWAGIGGVAMVTWVAARLPPIQSLEVPKRPPTVQILGLDGRPLATRGEMGGSAVALKDLPPYLPKAFLAIEDRRFYEHFGIDVFGIARALVANVLHRSVAQGGSTLTQQLAKNLFLTQERTLERKIQELVLALWLEHKFTKNQILELYLNRVYFGAGAYGVEAAAQRYFGKSARYVTLSEAALLAGLVKSPSRLAPTRNPEGAARRAQLVLAAMSEAGFASPEMVKVASAHPAKVVKNVGGGSVNYVADWVMDLLDDLVGRFDEDLVVETTVDPALQAAAEKALTEELDKKGQKFGVEQGALVAMTPDGAVRALVGGRNYAESQFNRAVAAKRQPGSAFKPFVYLTALEHGLSPETVREDRPINVRGWQPENYSREYFGPVTLTQALAMSLNTVAVRLTLEVTPKAVVQTAHRLGIASKLEPNASIALGTSEVSMLELVGAFATFANGGIAISPHVVERVRTASGRTLYQRGAPGLGRVIDPRYVGMMNAMMQQTILIGTARKAELPNWPAAGKTGTSQDFRDAWFVGYTARLVTGVWLGNDDSSPTRRTSGSGLPVEIWSRFMKVAHQGVPPAPLPGLGQAPAPAPAPPSDVVASAPPLPSGAARPVPAEAGMGLDRWLIEKIFGRR
ncbi:MAG: penicillin-binding protein 1A [Variibacter sp.]|nr:penicillin-binding protein 1A [Variibacter sp.]